MTRLVHRVCTPAAVATGLVVTVLAGAAAAAYRSGVASTGTGRATPAAAGATLTLAANGAAGTGLYPNGPGADVTVTVTNPYAGPVTVTAVAAAGAITATPAAGRTCATHDVTLVTPSSGLPATVPASGTATITLRAVVRMGPAAESGCQGASFTMPINVTGTL